MVLQRCTKLIGYLVEKQNQGSANKAILIEKNALAEVIFINYASKLLLII